MATKKPTRKAPAKPKAKAARKAPAPEPGVPFTSTASLTITYSDGHSDTTVWKGSLNNYAQPDVAARLVLEAD